MKVTDHKMKALGRELERRINDLSGDNGFVLLVLTGDDEIKFISNLEDDVALKTVSDFLQKSTPSSSPTILRGGSEG